MTPPRLLLSCVAAAIATLALATSAQAGHKPVPKDIAPPAGHKAYLDLHAVGVQIYSCNGTAWTLVAPRAKLYDRRGKLVGTHFGGPTWRAKDGRKVVGARVTGVNVDPTAVDWLLLSASSASEGPRGGDTLSGTTFIQRINTTGGLASSAGACSAANTGATAEIPYTADYRFWKERRGRCD